MKVLIRNRKTVAHMQRVLHDLAIRETGNDEKFQAHIGGRLDDKAIFGHIDADEIELHMIAKGEL